MVDKMDLSEKEKSIISEKREKSLKLLFYLGIVLIVISVGLVPYHIVKIRKIDSQWKKTFAEIDQIKPMTNQEKSLKLTLINSINYSKRLTDKFQLINLINKVSVPFTLGILAIGIYKISRVYLKIIRKLQA
jgi:hypothetical protein